MWQHGQACSPIVSTVVTLQKHCWVKTLACLFERELVQKTRSSLPLSLFVFLVMDFVCGENIR